MLYRPYFDQDQEITEAAIWYFWSEKDIQPRRFWWLASEIAHLKREGKWRHITPYWRRYIRDRLPYTRRYCDRLIRINEVMEELIIHHHSGDKTISEDDYFPRHPKHCEALLCTPAGTRALLWSALKERGGRITIERIRTWAE